MIQKGLVAALAVIITVAAVSSCNIDRFNDEEQRTLRMVYTDWSEGVALTYLSKVLLEDKLGYKVELKLTDVESAYRELAEDKSDVFADAWLPETQKVYYKQYEEELEQLGITYPEARTGFVVPEYSTLKKVSDLKSYQQPIIGIDSGAGVMMKAEKAIQKYGLPSELKASSEGEMVEHLKEAVKRRNEIVITGWEPHWIFARYEVRFLEDEDQVFGSREKIFTISRKGLAEEHPHAVRFFERMQMSEKQLNSLVYEMRMNEDPLIGIKEWIRQNEYVVNIWTKDLTPQRKKIY